jgi:ParB family chromosome partitioning protein
LKSSAKNISLTSLDDLFSTEDERSKDVVDTVINIPLSQLHDFPNHPFKVRDDEKMQETVESVKKYGILVPGIARKRPQGSGGGYEIISGHRRRRACELAGLTEMPMFVRDYSDDEAVVVMVDSNIQREDILPSEKARAYRMKYDALKHQGARGKKNTADAVGEAAGDSGTTVKRYIRLSHLRDSLLRQVDTGKITVVCGEQLSYLPEEEQALLEKTIEMILLHPSKKQAEQLRENSAAGTLDEQRIYEILTDRKKAETGIAIPYRRIMEFFPPETEKREIEEIILGLLKDWKSKQEGGA